MSNNSDSAAAAAAAASSADAAASSAVAAASSALAAASSAVSAAVSASSGFQFTNFSSGYFAWYLGGNNNTSQDEEGLLAIQLDLVGFLAILGEGSILANAEVAALSWFTFLPRIMPAPQALLRPSRATKLASHTGYTTAVASGNTRNYLNYVSQVVVEAESFPRHSVRSVKIERQYRTKKGKRGGHKTLDSSLTAKIWGPLTFVMLLGFTLSLLLLGLAIWHQDGFAVCGDVCISCLSTLTGLANKWTVKLQKRQNRGIRLLPGDVVIRYPNGNFLCIECDENVARELYFAPEGIDYLVNDLWQYRIISLLGTILLIFGVIFLANSSTWMQLIFAGSFVVLNISYWLVAALPSRVHWDTTCFKVTENAIENYDTKTKELILPTPRLHKEGKFVDLNPDYTWAVWKAILVTKEAIWAETSGAIPSTQAWKDWMREARDKAAEAKVRYEKIGGVEVKVFEHPKWDPKQAWEACQEATMNDAEKAEPCVVLDNSPNTLSLQSDASAGNNA